MSDIAIREALDGGDLDSWAQYEQAQNHLAIGANTRDLFVSAGTLYLRSGKVGLYDGTQYYAIANSVDRVISVAGLTASCWAKIELSVTAGNVVTTVSSIAGETNPKKTPQGVMPAYDGTKGGYYYSATKRCIALIYIGSAGTVTGIINLKSNEFSILPKYVGIPWQKNFAALEFGSLFTGTCTTDVLNALKDGGKTFTSVPIGAIVRNTTSKAWATVLYKTSTDELDLDADIFPAGNEAYAVYTNPAISELGCVELTGALLDGDGTKVANNDTINHLKDSVGVDWSLILVANKAWAMNLATGKIAKVTVVAAHDLTLQWDCFPNGNEKYMIFADYVTIADTDSPLNGEQLPEMNISGYYFGGGTTPGNKEDDTLQGHEHAYWLNQAAGAIQMLTLSSATQKRLSEVNVESSAIGDPRADTHSNGTPRAVDHTQPRTLRATMIMRIK